MYDYNNKSNEKQVKGTVPTGRIGSPLSAWSVQEKQSLNFTLLDTYQLSSPGAHLPPASETHPEFSSAQSLSQVLFFAILWTIAHQAPRPWDFPSKNTGAGCHFLGDLPDSGIEPPSVSSPALANIFFTTPSPGKLFQMGVSNNRE